MFKKFSLGIARSRAEGDDASRGRRQRLLSAPPTRPRPTSGLDFSDGPVQHDYLNSRLEALDLEPMVAPFLSPMRRMVITPEQAALARPRGRNMSVADGVRMHLAERRLSAAELADRDPEMPALLSRPLNTPSSPTCELANPFDDPDQNRLIVTPIPRRPTLQRNAVSARGRRDLPLRVQAIRRSHQQAFAEALMVRAMQEMAEEAEPAMEDSALWSRRRRSSPENVLRPAPRLGRMPTPQYDKKHDMQLFSLTDENGLLRPYDMTEARTSPQQPSPPTEVDPHQDVQFYVDESGRTWL